MITSNIRWEVRFEYESAVKSISEIKSYSTRFQARNFMRVAKRLPDWHKNVRMYRVNEFLDEQGNPVMTFHKRAR